MSSRLWQCGKYFLLDLSRADFLFPVYYAIKYNTYQATYYWEIISQPCQLARYFLSSFCWSSLHFPHGPDVTAGRMVSASWIWAHSKWSRQHTTYSDSHRHCGRGWLWAILCGWTPKLDWGYVEDIGYWRAGRGVSPYTCPSAEGGRPEICPITLTENGIICWSWKYSKYRELRIDRMSVKTLSIFLHIHLLTCREPCGFFGGQGPRNDFAEVKWVRRTPGGVWSARVSSLNLNKDLLFSGVSGHAVLCMCILTAMYTRNLLSLWPQ